MGRKGVLGLSAQDLLLKFSTSIKGLSQKEAETNLAYFGPNLLGKKSANAIKILLRQFQSSLIYLLVIASVISYWIKDYSDGTIILIILLVNTFLGFYQEYKSERIIEKLSRLITKQVMVRRDGQTALIDESQIVPGDILIVREGDIVPADIALLEAGNLQVNESQLTGESIPINKKATAEISEENILSAGSTIEKGEGIGIVYATGKNTELGILAVLSTETKKQTQYEKSLHSFSVFLMKVVLSGLGLVFVFKIILNKGFSNITELFIFIIAMAVAVVPEVLPVIATVTLSSGALKLAKKHVVIKRLSSLEDLGNVNLLCTDKTGTITENKMAVNSIAASDDDLFQKLILATIDPVKRRKHVAQNSYENAFISYVPDRLQKEARELTIAKELPFDPNDRRSRSIIKDNKNNQYYLVVLGAPEALLKISGNSDKKYLDEIAQEGKSGLHHLALSYKKIGYKDNFDILKNERGLIFLGYASFNDPLRSTAKETIEHAEKLGIKIKILTGDSKEVAQYIGKKIDLIQEDGEIYSGSELEKMTPVEFKSAVSNCNIFARITPGQKYEIIKALKENYIVAYQGDGINDAPALKMADVAIAVSSATDIAKENADIILLNRSLEVIINGIKYGRSIFVNINKYIKYTMVSNFGNFIALSFLYLFSADLPLLPIQVLLTTVITDIPLITIFSDTVEDADVVRPEKHDIKELVLISLILGVPTALFELFYFSIIHSQPQKLVQTNLYVFLTFLALIVFFTIRNKNYFWKTRRPSSLLSISFLLAFIFSLGVVYVPQFQTWFSFVPMSRAAVLSIIFLMIIYFFAADLMKVIYYRSFRKIPYFSKNF